MKRIIYSRLSLNRTIGLQNGKGARNIPQKNEQQASAMQAIPLAVIPVVATSIFEASTTTSTIIVRAKGPSNSTPT